MELDEDRFYALGGWPTDKIIELLARERGLTVDVAAVALEKENEFEEILHHVTGIEHVVGSRGRYAGKLPLAVATGGVRRICERILKHVGILELFDHIATATMSKRHKPNPDVFLEAARRLNVAPEHCLVYEDTDPGIEAAKRAGCTGSTYARFICHGVLRRYLSPNNLTHTGQLTLPGRWEKQRCPTLLFPAYLSTTSLAARERIRNGIELTPCAASLGLSRLTDKQIYCKLDSLQATGSFKERGARNALLPLDEAQQKKGVIAASGRKPCAGTVVPRRGSWASRHRGYARVCAANQDQHLSHTRGECCSRRRLVPSRNRARAQTW